MEFGYRSALGAILMSSWGESWQLKTVYKNKSNAKYFSKLIGILNPGKIRIDVFALKYKYNSFIHNFTDIRKESK